MNTQELLKKLHEIHIIKYGDFTFKSGKKSSNYVDLRPLVSYPVILNLLAECLWEHMKDVSFDLICGVPYTALPIATAIALTHQKPMLLKRKEGKDYGTKKLVEGVFLPGQTCAIIEDVVTTGSSVIETANVLKAEGLKVTDVFVVVEREKAARDHLLEQGYCLHALFDLETLQKTESMPIPLEDAKIASSVNTSQTASPHEGEDGAKRQERGNKNTI